MRILNLILAGALLALPVTAGASDPNNNDGGEIFNDGEDAPFLLFNLNTGHSLDRAGHSGGVILGGGITLGKLPPRKNDAGERSPWGASLTLDLSSHLGSGNQFTMLAGSLDLYWIPRSRGAFFKQWLLPTSFRVSPSLVRFLNNDSKDSTGWAITLGLGLFQLSAPKTCEAYFKFTSRSRRPAYAYFEAGLIWQIPYGHVISLIKKMTSL